MQSLLQGTTLFLKLFRGGHLEATFWVCKLNKGFQAELVPQAEKGTFCFKSKPNVVLHCTRTYAFFFFFLYVLCFVLVFRLEKPEKDSLFSTPEKSNFLIYSSPQFFRSFAEKKDPLFAHLSEL